MLFQDVEVENFDVLTHQMAETQVNSPASYSVEIQGKRDFTSYHANLSGMREQSRAGENNLTINQV